VGWLFSFSGKIGRPAYAAASVAALFLPHLIILAVYAAQQQRPPLNAWFVLAPLRWVVTLDGRLQFAPLFAADHPVLLAGGLALAVLCSWVLAALAVRRANDAGESGWLAALSIAPVLQFPAILMLAVLPSRAAAAPPDASLPVIPQRSWTASLQGLLAAIGLTLLTIVVGALFFGSYGYSMFALSPVVIGVTTAYLANRHGDVGVGSTIRVMTAALAVGGLALVGAAFEGVVCIVMAAPLAWVMALIGALIGRAMALSRRARGTHPMLSVAIIPLLFASEQALPRTSAFTDAVSIEVAATPDAVWQAVLNMDTITEAPSMLFRLGIAYPVRGEVIGEGVGARRRGYFSTGVAEEEITEWAPGEALAFVILSEPPSLRELSPYQHVHAPHVNGYFRSAQARIDIAEIAWGRTRVTLTTAHELDLQPAVYWLPLARWIVRENKGRVLRQIQRQAETGPAQ
jgi:uncharacterized membrane protein YhaH (DUF805 family)